MTTLPNTPRDQWIKKNRAELDDIFDNYLKQWNPDFYRWADWLYFTTRETFPTDETSDSSWDEEDSVLDGYLHRTFEAIRDSGISSFLGPKDYVSFTDVALG